MVMVIGRWFHFLDRGYFLEIEILSVLAQDSSEWLCLNCLRPCLRPRR